MLYSVIMCVALCTFYGSMMWSSYFKRWFAVYVKCWMLKRVKIAV